VYVEVCLLMSTAKAYDGVARVAQALASGTRLKMLALLIQRERAVLDVAESAGLDVRPADEYAAGHLKGAVSIPLAELADRLAEIPTDA
jgi:hypothetical protein